MTCLGSSSDQKRHARCPGCWSAARGCTLSVFLKLVPKLAETDAEEFRGSRLNAARAGQGHLQVAVLDLIQRRLEIEPVGRDLHGNLLRLANLMEVRGQRLGREDVSAAQDERPLDHVLELPDIARPAVAFQNRQRLGADAPHDLAELRGDFPDEMLGEQDRKSTRLNSSHQIISYAVFCLKKKKNYAK